MKIIHRSKTFYEDVNKIPVPDLQRRVNIVEPYFCLLIVQMLREWCYLGYVDGIF